MKERIIPEILEYKDEVLTVLEVNIPDCVALFDGYGKCVIAKIKPDGTFEKTIMPPGCIGEDIYSDPQHNVIWAKRGRRFSALDIETKKTGELIVSHDGDDNIHHIILADPEKRIFAIDIIGYASHIEDSPIHYILYDLFNNKTIYSSKNYNGFLFPYAKNTLLWEDFLSDSKGIDSISRWQFTDLQLNKLPGNNLTLKLNESGMNVWYKNGIPFHFGKRIMIGKEIRSENQVCCTIRWDEELRNVKIEPFYVRERGGYFLSDFFTFSGEGNWVRTTITPDNKDQSELTFYRVDDSYPQGLSPPIFGGITGNLTHGAFVTHSVWGPIYVEMDDSHPSILLMYKLNDGLNYLKKLGLKGK